MMTIYDRYVGCKFNKLTLLEVTNEFTSKARYGIFKCECGNVKKIIIKNVLRGRNTTYSCGCASLKNVDVRTDKDLIKKHKRTYRSWASMINRANGKYKHPTNYKYYANVKVCPEWRLFENFLKDMGGRPEGTTLDRIDSTKDYSPENCRWSDLKTQQNNRKCTLMVNAFGEVLSISDFSRKYNVNYNTAKWNHYHGKDLEQLVLKHRNN